MLTRVGGDACTSPKDKSNFHILRPTRAFGLGYHALIAYSFLVRRSRLTLPTSQRKLGRLTGFSPHTLVAVVRALIEANLAVRDGYNLIAQPDANSQFHVKGERKDRWEGQYQTTIVYDLAPDAPLTAIENHILCAMLSFNANGKVPEPSAIAQLLCLSERTVRDKLKRLRRLGLVDAAKRCVTISEDRRGCWLDAKPKAEKPDLLLLNQVSPQNLPVGSGLRARRGGRGRPCPGVPGICTALERHATVAGRTRRLAVRRGEPRAECACCLELSAGLTSAFQPR